MAHEFWKLFVERYKSIKSLISNAFKFFLEFRLCVLLSSNAATVVKIPLIASIGTINVGRS